MDLLLFTVIPPVLIQFFSARGALETGGPAWVLRLDSAHCLIPDTAMLCTMYFCRNRNIMVSGMALNTATAILGP